VKAQRILVVLDDCGPGDALRVHFCAHAIRERYPQASLELLVGEQAAPLFERQQLFDRVLVSALYKLGSRSRWWPPARKAAVAARLALRLGRVYDMAFTFYWGTSLLNLLVRLSTHGPAYGYANAWPALVDGGLGRYNPEAGAIEQAVALVGAAGIMATCPEPVLRPRQNGSPTGPGRVLPRLPIVLHPGSDWACQMWPAERWAELADRLNAETGGSIVFTGSAGEVGDVERIRALMRAPSASLAGQTNVTELGEVLAGAVLCVCVDSLAYELAQSAGTPTVVLAGESRTRPDVPGKGAPIVVNRTSPELRSAILDCKLSHAKAALGGCLDWSCPMAGLRSIQVGDVVSSALARLEATGRVAAGTAAL
jgi:ADP-heptose:LPS heptosyltransferase